MVSGIEPDPNEADNTAREDTEVTPVADLSVTKTASANPSVLGVHLTYVVTVTNHGPSAANEVTVIDTLPGSVVYVSSQLRLGPFAPSQTGCELQPGGVTIECAIGTLARGATSTVTIVVDPKTDRTITNVVVVAAAELDRDPSDNTTSTDTVIVPGADVSVDAEDSSDPVVAGGTITYTLTVSNSGPSSATGVTFESRLPPEVSFRSAEPSRNCTEFGGDITCVVGNLGSGTVRTITIVVDAPPTVGTITTTASVVAKQFDPDLTNNTVTERTEVRNAADLSVSVAGSPDPVVAGASLVYSVTATNNGPSAATDVTLTDTLPTGVTLVSATSTQGNCDVTGITVTCALGTLEVNDISTATIVVKPTTTGVITNRAEVTGNVVDRVEENNVVSQDTEVLPGADLALTKTDYPEWSGCGGQPTLHACGHQQRSFGRHGSKLLLHSAGSSQVCLLHCRQQCVPLDRARCHLQPGHPGGQRQLDDYDRGHPDGGGYDHEHRKGHGERGRSRPDRQRCIPRDQGRPRRRSRSDHKRCPRSRDRHVSSGLHSDRHQQRPDGRGRGDPGRRATSGGVPRTFRAERLELRRGSRDHCL